MAPRCTRVRERPQSAANRTHIVLSLDCCQLAICFALAVSLKSCRWNLLEGANCLLEGIFPFHYSEPVLLQNRFLDDAGVHDDHVLPVIRIIGKITIARIWEWFIQRKE